MTGVPHLAVVHYEKVLEMVQKRMDAEEHEDVKEVSYERKRSSWSGYPPYFPCV